MSKTKNTHASAQASRKTGWEWKAAGWLVRHPLFGTLPAAALLAEVEFGAMPTTLAVGSTVAALGGWYRAHPASFDATIGPWLRAQRRRWSSYLGPRWRRLLDACDLVRVHNRTGEVQVPRVVRVRSASPSIAP